MMTLRPGKHFLKSNPARLRNRGLLDYDYFSFSLGSRLLDYDYLKKISCTRLPDYDYF
jgi:hypothetical protein